MQKRLTALILVIGMIVTVFAGCGSNGTSNNTAASTAAVSSTEKTAASSDNASTTAGTEKKEPVTLKIWRPANVVDPNTDPIMQEVGKILNVKVEIVTAPWDQEVNTLNLKMSSKEDIDIIQAESGSQWVKWAQDGLMNDIDELLKGQESAFPYIKSITSAESFQGLKVNKKTYYIPGAHHGQDWGLFIRKDWLDKVGLPEPKTTEDLYNVLKAFRDKDPDGSNKKDTIGYQASMAGADNFGDFDPIIHAFGGSFGGFFEDYVIKDGKVVPLEITDDTKEGFKFLNRLYREKLINTDFASLKNVDEANAKYLYANKAGVLWTSRAAEFEGNIKKTAPDANLQFLSPLQAEGHKFVKTQGMAWWMLIGIPKAAKHPQEALKFIEFINSEEGRKLVVAGIKGRHYTNITEDGIYDRNKANWEKDYDVKANGYDYPLWWGFLSTVHGYIPVKKYPTFEEALRNEVMLLGDEDAKLKFNWKTAVKYGAEYNEPNPFHAVFIDEAVPIRNKLQSDVKAVYFLKMIIAKDTGEVEKLWNEYMKAWRDAGGDKVIAAYQDFYDKNLKK